MIKQLLDWAETELASARHDAAERLTAAEAEQARALAEIAANLEPESPLVADLRAELTAAYEAIAELEAELERARAETFHWRVEQGATAIEFQHYKNGVRAWAAERLAQKHAKSGPGVN